MVAIESLIARVVDEVSSKLFADSSKARRSQRLKDAAAVSTRETLAKRLLGSMGEINTSKLICYLESPEFGDVVYRAALWRVCKEGRAKQIEPILLDEVQAAVSLNLQELGDNQLQLAVDLVGQCLFDAVAHVTSGRGRGDVHETVEKSAELLISATVRNGNLLSQIVSLEKFSPFVESVRAQVREAHGQMRMPHLGIARSVPYSSLYVEPSLSGLTDLTGPGRRSVVLGDPGAGKSTLAAKIAWQVASSKEDKRVPFLVVLRNFRDRLREGGRGVVAYLTSVCEDPYNIVVPPDAMEYLLGNGRAVVILDGVDELVEPEVRRNFVMLTESFANIYPTVPIIVTARKIGYAEAPLRSGIFREGYIEEFGEGAVEEYSRRWFSLDESAPPAERQALAEAFLRESEPVSELRSNPLLLALLCAMYAYENYIPANLAQVYEKCALMMFEQWDRRRGMREIPRFQGRIRSAVGYLAWRQFSTSETGLPKRKVVQILGEFLAGKGYEADEARADAEGFVEFCSGRPWILSDTGSGRSGPSYGFTHRTFLEYFAAEHVVRTNPDADSLTRVLVPAITQKKWEVPAQIVVQLFEQNQDDGASQLMLIFIRESSFVALEFCVKALSYSYPNPSVIRTLIESLVEKAVAVSADEQLRYWPSLDYKTRVEIWDKLLKQAMNQSLLANREMVAKAVVRTLRAKMDDGVKSAYLTWLRIGLDERSVKHLSGMGGSIVHLESTPDLGGALARFGVHVLYVSAGPPALVNRPDRWGSIDSKALLEASRPWIIGTEWQKDFDACKQLPALRYSLRHVEVNILLVLPYLETFERHRRRCDMDLGRFVMYNLVHGRRDDYIRECALNELRGMSVSAPVVDFLNRWMLREFDLVQ